MLQVNLLPWREQRRSERQAKRLIEALSAALLAFLLLLLLHALLGWQLQAVSTRLQQIQKGLATMTHGVEEWRRLYQTLDYQPLSALDGRVVFKHQQQLLLFLKKFAQIWPQEMRAHKLQWEAQQVSLEATALALAPIPEFAERLKTALGAQRVEKKLIIKRGQGLFHYELHFEGGL